jgi:hypothetical protein
MILYILIIMFLRGRREKKSYNSIPPIRLHGVVLSYVQRQVKGKGKVVPVLPLTEHVMKVYWGSEDTAPPIL